MYIFFGYNQNIKYYQVLRLDFETLDWQTMLENSDYLYGSSIVSSDDKLYFLLGKSESNYENSVKVFDYKLGSFNVLTESVNLPKARKNHISWSYNNSIYIFGGVSKNNEYLNDMWRFDINEEKWHEVKVSGSIPEGRESMGFYFVPGNILIVIGGKAGSKVFSDFYIYEPRSSVWVVKNEIENMVSERFSSCVFFANLKVIVFGGQNSQGYLNDLWIYDFHLNSFINIEVTGAAQIMNYKCVMTQNNDEIDIYVISGKNSNNEPNDSIFLVQILNFSTEIPVASIKKYWQNDNFLLNNFSIVFQSSTIYLLGGQNNQYLSKSILILDLKKRLLRSVPVPQDLWISGHTSSHFAKSLFIFGGVHSPNGYQTSSTPSSTLYKLTSTNLDLNLNCSQTLSVSSECFSCKAGYYLESNVCKPCPAGTFSPYDGAVGLIMCVPCFNGEFNDLTGKKLCKKCSEGYNCPISSKEQKVRMRLMESYSNQPKEFESETLRIENVNQNILYGLLAVCIFLINFLVFSSNFRALIKKVDIFVDQHSQELNVPVVYTKTPLGGYFTISFIMLALITCMYTAVSFFKDNIVETKSLVPSVVMEEEFFESDLELNINFYDFNGNCSSLSASLEETAIKYSKRKIYYLKGTSDCLVQVIYSNFHLLSDAELEFGFKDEVASCSFLSINISSSSSIPKEPSELFIPLYPSDNSLIFRGFPSSTFKFSLIPSVILIQVFYSDSNIYDPKITGYHLVDTNSHVPGLSVDQNS